MKKMLNRVDIQGYVYEHDLKISKVKKTDSPNFGKEFITGKVSIATDEECVNVVTVKFGYVTPTTKNGSPSKNYEVLEKIMNGGATVVANGKENALKVKVSPSLICNDFYNRDGELVSGKSLDGGFISIVNSVEPKAKFEVDFFATKATHVDENPDKQTPEYVKVDGYVFTFNGAIHPVTLNVKNELGMSFFENNVEDKKPLFVKVGGDIISKSIKVTKEEQGAWSTIVKEYTQSFKEYLINEANEPYDLNDDSILTQDEFKKALADREVHLAEVKQQYEERQNAPATPAAAPAAQGNFGW